MQNQETAPRLRIESSNYNVLCLAVESVIANKQVTEVTGGAIAAVQKRHPAVDWSCSFTNGHRSSSAPVMSLRLPR